WDETLHAFLPGAPAERVRCAGACRGVMDLGAALEDGRSAGNAAAREATDPARKGVRPQDALKRPTLPTIEGARDAGRAVEPPASAARDGVLPPAAGARGRAFVDWQNDVTTKDLALATREGFRSIEHVKRYTTTGMATDQGKTSNLNALAFVSRKLGK